MPAQTTMKPATQEKIHCLWDELSDFNVSQSDQAAAHLMTMLGRLVEALNVTWGGAVRMDGDCRNDPLRGWRVSAMKLLHPVASHPEGDPFKDILKLWDQREIDASFLLPMRGVGRFRAYTFRKDLPPEWFDSPFYQGHYASAGIRDAVFVGFPLNRDAESHFGFYADKPFTDEDIVLLSYALRGIKWFHRQLMLSHALLMASSPLTPAERKVLHLLLTGVPEKTIAERISRSATTVHQHVVNIFRKFGVRSRVELMSLWLTCGE